MAERSIVLVTGGSRGIGAAIVRAFAAQGDAVVFLYREREREAGALVSEMRGAGRDVEGIRCDVSDGEDVRRVLGEVLRRYHRVDVLVNNAGVAHLGLFTDTDEAAWRRVMGVNLDGVYHCTRAVLPGMISRKAGCVINVSSMWGQVGGSCEVAYSASKAAVIGLTKALAKELGPSGIRVNCVAPGVIDTEMNAALSAEDLDAIADETPLCRIGTAGEVAEVVRFLASAGAAFMTGQVLGVSGGLVI